MLALTEAVAVMMRRQVDTLCPQLLFLRLLLCIIRFMLWCEVLATSSCPQHELGI